MSKLSDVVAAAESLSPVEKVMLIKQVAAYLRDEMPANTPRPSRYNLWDGVSPIDEDRQNQWQRFLRDNL